MWFDTFFTLLDMGLTGCRVIQLEPKFACGCLVQPPRVSDNYTVHLTHRGTPGSVHLAAPGVPSLSVPRIMVHLGVPKNHGTPGVPRIMVHLGVPKNYGKPGVPTIMVHLNVPTILARQVYQELRYT